MLIIDTNSDLVVVVLVDHPLQYLGTPDHFPVVQLREIHQVSVKIFLPRFLLFRLLRRPILLLSQLFSLLIGNISDILSLVKCHVMSCHVM